jgi:paraquat-inducible protein B
MKDIDIGDIAMNLNRLITEARTQVNGLELGPMIAEWTKTAKSINEFTTSPELKITVSNLNLAATELRSVLKKLDGHIDPTADKLGVTLEESKATLASFNAAAMTLRQFINAHHELGTGANQAFIKLADAAESVERLADFLERNPQALLTGRKIPNN